MGPILFIIYVNDLPEVVTSNLWMFADDSKIYCTITSDEDINRLQEDLHNVSIWCSKWLMTLNLDKCKCISFGSCALPMNQYTISLGDEDTYVARVHEQSDLGVLFTSNLKFGPHIHHIVQKGNRCIGLIKRSF